MLRLFLTLSILFSVGFSVAQKKVLSGYLFDKSSNETIIGGAVFSLESKNGATTNEYGYYSLSLDENDSLVKVRAFGFKDTTVIISNIENINSFNVYLKSKITNFEEVEVIGKKSDIKADEMGVISIPMEDVRRLPNLFGEVDIIKTYQLTPGVESGGENSSNYYVRGGGAEQNLMLLDDVPLYNVSHFGGFFSVFNADIIKSTKLMKSGFPAEYSGRLSSVLDVRMKEGNSKEFQVQGAVGLLSTRLSIEGPIIKDKASFIVSGRINPLPIFKILGEGIDYRFNDLNAKLNFNSSDNNKFYLSFYRGRDNLKINSDNEGLSTLDNKLSWGNTMLAFRWNHKFGARLFSNTTVYLTDYKYYEEFRFEEETENSHQEMNNKLTTGVRDYGFKNDYSFFINDKLNLHFGVNAIYHDFNPNDIEYSQKGSEIEDLERNQLSQLLTFESGAYADMDLDYNWFSLKGGLRYSNYSVEGANYSNLEPRVVSSLNFLKTWSLKYSYTVMHQYIHLLSYSGTGLPSDYWMPTNNEIPPSRGVQHSVGLYKSINKDKYVVSLEGYHKTANNVISFKPGKSLMGYVDEWEDLVEKNGENRAYGIEFLAQKKKGKLTGWISTTVSRSLLKYETLNGGREFPFKYDRPLSVNIVGIYKLNKKIDLSATWNYGSGYPLTLANEIYTYDGDDIYHFEGINSQRMRDYHRLDIAFNHTKETKWGERTWTISIFNLYGRKNPYYYFYQHDLIPVQTEFSTSYEKGELKLYQQSFFGFFPSFSYSFKLK
ncbi:TonB-dependent receptor [Brumimicrobium aurantiacum]|uniref:TonB-dependent receptor n=1 Tax=Brumimicrobium aurantiacum TaxID=1737063 RepID=A0A3E1EVC2_9FLAO|nr:carboxypeptidase-like regulatory domain-containing protein [Brumimicrobium aurantiacum]RFC53505.1 TonB-dependent receptor [Brumimicrobium aurantiacum]